jgi:hypothetical protein
MKKKHVSQAGRNKEDFILYGRKESDWEEIDGSFKSYSLFGF